jgi:MFS family permease
VWASRGAGRAAPSRDANASAAATAAFSLSLGMTTVALPLLALRAGYSHTEIGVLTALSALSQMATRLVLGAVMRHYADWTLIVGAGLVLALSNAAVALSAALVPFVLAQLLQGAARACFWTGSQTHVVRGPGRAVGALARMNLIGSSGLLAGPLLAGQLSRGTPSDALAVAAGVAAVGLAPALLLDRLPPFAPPEDRPPGRLWRRPGVDVGCWTGVTAGAWRALLSSYVPVAMDAARLSSATIGVLVAVANGAALLGSAVVGRVRSRAEAPLLLAATVAAGLGTGLTALLAHNVLLVGLALTLSGLGAGALQTLGPAVATQAVHPEERGDAIAVAGTFRAASLLATPLAVAALVAVLPLTGALAVVAAGMAVPSALTRLGRRDGHA